MAIPKDKDGLTVKQKAFARAYVHNGGYSERAAIEAGYGEAGARSRAGECLRVPEVQEEIRKASNELMSEYAPMCIRVLAELARTADSETVRNNAAQTLLDRTGYKLPVQVDVVDARTAQDVERDLAVILGIPTDNASQTAPEGAQEPGPGPIH